MIVYFLFNAKKTFSVSDELSHKFDCILPVASMVNTCVGYCINNLSK